MVGAMATLASGIIGSATSAGVSAYSNHHSAKEARAADYRSQKYHVKNLLNDPSLSRQGLEKAGYNPMLAISGGASMSGSSPSSHMGQTHVPDVVGSAKVGAQLAQDIAYGYKLQNEKTQKEIENLESDLDTKEIQRLQTEANTSLALSQTERSDLAYGRDIASTITDAVGTAGAIYGGIQSAKMAKEMAQMRYDATYGTHEKITTHHKGDKLKPSETIESKRLTPPRKDAPVAPLTKGTPKRIPSKNAIPSAIAHSVKAAEPYVLGLGGIGAMSLIGGYAGKWAKGKSEELNRKTNHDSKGKERVKFRGYGRLHSFH